MRIYITGVFGMIYSFILLVAWIMGVVYASALGGWHLFFAVCFGPFYAWFLVVKNMMIYFGLIHGCF
jgi:hypothetical protein